MAGVITKMIHHKAGSSGPTCAQGNDSDTADTTGGASGPAGLDVQTAHHIPHSVRHNMGQCFDV